MKEKLIILFVILFSNSVFCGLWEVSNNTSKKVKVILGWARVFFGKTKEELFDKNETKTMDIGRFSCLTDIYLYKLSDAESKLGKYEFHYPQCGDGKIELSEKNDKISIKIGKKK